MKKTAIDFFVKETKFEEVDIKSIEKLTNGHSKNENFLFELNDGQKFQVKLPYGKGTNLRNTDVAVLYDAAIYLYLDKQGKMIKTGIEGEHPDFTNPQHIQGVLEEIEKFHNIDILDYEFDTFGLLAYRSETKIERKYIDEFDALAERLQLDSMTLTHGDINSKNIIVGEDRAYLIDLEGTRMGYPVLDYAYLVAFTDINIEDVFEFTDYDREGFKKMIRLALIHTLMGCERENSVKSKELSEEIMIKLNA